MKSGNITSLNLNDAEIIQKILAGEKLFFELLMRRYNAALYKVGRSYGLGHEDTEDLMQDAHVTAYLNLAKFEHRSQYKTWLIKIMINKCLTRLGKAEYKNEHYPIASTNEKTNPMFSNSDSYDTEKQVINHELAHLLETGIAQIPMDYRMVFVLREKEGLSVAETAEALDISEANVKVRLNRARAMLRQKLEGYYTSLPVYEFNLIYCDRIVQRVFSQIEKLKI